MTPLLLLLLLLAAPAWADDLGCVVSGGTVSGAFTQFTGTATSVAAGVTDKDDAIGSPYVSPTMTDRGSNVWTAADFAAGATLGLHKIRMTGTVDGATQTGIDTFTVATACPLTPTVADRTLAVGTDNFADANVEKWNATLVPAEHTAGYPIATIKDGTGPGEIDTLSGAIVKSTTTANCDISDSTSGASFTIATCTDANGNAITLVDDKFNGLGLIATTNGGATCNVNGEAVLIEDTTVAGVITAKTDGPPNSGFKAAPSATNCGAQIGL